MPRKLVFLLLLVLASCSAAVKPPFRGKPKGKGRPPPFGKGKRGPSDAELNKKVDEEIRAAFPKLDKNGDGKLTKDELGHRIKTKHNKMMANDSVQKRFKEWDKSGDGHLTKDEAPGGEKAWAARYAKMDKDGDGKVSMDEFKHLSEEMLAKRLESMMATDADKDGTLSLEEFVKMGMRGAGLANDGPPSETMKMHSRRMQQQKAREKHSRRKPDQKKLEYERKKRETNQRKTLAANFEKWDLNGDGRLDASEIKARLRQTSDENMKDTEYYIKNHFTQEDKDKDGFLDEKIAEGHIKRDPAIDKNKDRKIDYNEFKAFRMPKMMDGAKRRVDTMTEKIETAHAKGDLPISKEDLLKFGGGPNGPGASEQTGAWLRFTLLSRQQMRAEL